MDKAKKKRVRKVISWTAMAAVVALLAAMPLIARQEAEADGPVASILSAKAEKGSLTSAIHGGGTVEAETVEEVKLPDGVKITGFLVKNGQFVEEGTPLATLDKVSVMTAITQVSETLDYLREELQAARDETVPSAIKATAGGRVKKVFARKGESVQEVMLRDGCLAVLSLDGMMAVKLEGSFPVTTGESLTVTLADGEAVTGRVESNLDGVVVITLEDEGYEIGQTVTVSSEDGQKLGEGPLYIHNAWKATAYSGTVETVSAREEKTVSSGATLFTLTDRDYEGELRRRAGQHREYEELLQELFQMYESGILTAPCAGEVEGVDEDSAFLLSAVPQGWTLAPLTDTVTEGQEKGWTVMLLSSVTPGGCTVGEDCPLPADSPAHDEECVMKCDESIRCDAKNHKKNCIKRCESQNRSCPATVHYDGCISVCTGKAGCQALPEKHKTGCPEKCTDNAACKSSRPKDEHGANCIIHCIKDTDASDDTRCTAHSHYPVCVELCTGTNACTAINHKADCYYYGVTYTARAAVVVRSASGTIEYKYDSKAAPVTVTRSADGGWVLPAAPSTQTMNDTGFIASNVSCSTGSIILIISGTNAAGETVVENRVYTYTSESANSKPGSMGNLSGFGGMNIAGMIGGLSGFGNYGAAIQEEDEDLFDLEGQTLLTVTPHDTASLVISVDEHDIAKLSVGMKATVKIEALKSREFPAEITSIAISGTNNGGSSKFSVELTLPMIEDMLSGMSASAVIELEEKQDILLIPASALVQQGAKTVVFTALNEKTGQPASPVEVKTGLSDGDQVEILSGLTEGQTIYYSYYDTVELDTSAEADKYTLR